MKRLFLLLISAMLLMPVLGARAVTAAPAERVVESAMIDAWVFVDNDRNGVYSTGDIGLTDAVVCVYPLPPQWANCVGTDLGDTWWEDLDAARYSITVDKTTVPSIYKLNSIRCYDTQTHKKFKCDTYKSTWRAYAKLKLDTRINVFFALVPK